MNWKPWKKKETQVEDLSPPIVKFLEIPLDTVENLDKDLVRDAELFVDVMNDFMWDTMNDEQPIMSGIQAGTNAAHSIYIPQYGTQMNTAVWAAVNSVKNARLLAAIILDLHKAGTSFDYMTILDDALSSHMPTTK